jgi:type II secretory pathway pseudopilin PulG
MEVIVVLVIIAVIAVIFFATSSASMSVAKGTSDLSNLRQIGQAQALYLTDYFDGQWVSRDSGNVRPEDVLPEARRARGTLAAWNTDAIGENAELDAQVWVSELDSDEDPLLNRWSRANPAHFQLTYGSPPLLKTSYLPLFVMSPGTLLSDQFQEGRCAWLLNVLTAECIDKASPDCAYGRSGPISQLYPDGRVKMSQLTPESLNAGPGYGWSSRSIWGCDMTPELTERLKS